MKTKIVPTHDWLLVRKQEQETRSAGGIFMPETARGLERAEVLAVGPGRVNESGARMPVAIKPKSGVLFRPGIAVQPVPGEDATLWLIRDGDVLAMVDA